MNNNKNKRCSVCDYCSISSHGEPPRTFSTAHGSDDYVCQVCVDYITEALEEFLGEDDEPTMPLEVPLSPCKEVLHEDKT